MRKLFFTWVLLVFSIGAKAQMFAVGTDALADALMAPNISLEMVTGERTTLGLHALATVKPWWEKDVKKVVAIQPEYRYFFSGRPMHKQFVGLAGVAGIYDLTWKGKVYDGMAGGIGLTFGYVFNLTDRFNIDCHAGFGAILYKQKEYFEYDNYDADYSVNGKVRTNASGYFLLPTRIGVSLSYILK